MRSLPTNETDGALSNELRKIFGDLARDLAFMRESGTTDSDAYRESLKLYVTLALAELRRFYR